MGLIGGESKDETKILQGDSEPDETANQGLKDERWQITHEFRSIGSKNAFDKLFLE